MWQSILETAEIGWLRQNAERRLAQLQALDRIDQLQRTVDEYERRTGQPPQGWADLVRARMTPGMPLDPSRTPFELKDGRVLLSDRSPLWPLPDEPGHTDRPTT